METRIYIDCTSTLQSPFQSGIQRVVRNLIQYGDANDGKWKVFPSVFGRAACYNVSLSHLETTGTARKVLSSHGWVNSSTTPAWQRKLSRLPYRIAKLVYPRKLAEWVREAKLSLFAEQAQFQVGDVLLLADSSWRNTDWNAVRAAKERGAKIGAVIYDLIPLSHAEFFEDDLPKHFVSWLHNVHIYADFLMTISKATTAALENAQTQLSLKPRLTCEFELGSSEPVATGSPIRMCISELFSGSPDCCPTTYVVLGTLEPHKNHSCVLEAFDMLWKDNQNVRLLIVGRRGRSSGALQKKLRSHPRWGKQLLGFDDASDVEVAFLLDRMYSLVFASIIEGYGLPIIEAARRGGRILASDIPVHREVAGDLADYFDPTSPKSLVTALQRQRSASRNNPQRRIASSHPILDWPEAARKAMAICHKLSLVASKASNGGALEQ